MYEVSCFPCKRSDHPGGEWTADLTKKISLEIEDPIAARDLQTRLDAEIVLPIPVT